MATSEEIHEAVHVARLRAEFDADHGKPIEGARRFIQAICAQMAAVTREQHLDAWRTILDAENLLLAHPAFTHGDRMILYPELRFENDMVITSRAKPKKNRIEKTNLESPLIDKLNSRPEKDMALAHALDIDQKTLKLVREGGQVTFKTARKIKAKADALPAVPAKTPSAAGIKRALAAK